MPINVVYWGVKNRALLPQLIASYGGHELILLVAQPKFRLKPYISRRIGLCPSLRLHASLYRVSSDVPIFGQE
jgi:hypothetical protein